MKRKKKRKKKENEKPGDSTVIVEQQTDPTRTAFEIALDKECLQERSDADQFVNSAFSCLLLEFQT